MNYDYEIATTEVAKLECRNYEIEHNSKGRYEEYLENIKNGKRMTPFKKEMTDEELVKSMLEGYWSILGNNNPFIFPEDRHMIVVRNTVAKELNKIEKELDERLENYKRWHPEKYENLINQIKEEKDKQNERLAKEMNQMKGLEAYKNLIPLWEENFEKKLSDPNVKFNKTDFEQTRSDNENAVKDFAIIELAVERQLLPKEKVNKDNYDIITKEGLRDIREQINNNYEYRTINNHLAKKFNKMIPDSETKMSDNQIIEGLLKGYWQLVSWENPAFYKKTPVMEMSRLMLAKKLKGYQEEFDSRIKKYNIEDPKKAENLESILDLDENHQNSKLVDFFNKEIEGLDLTTEDMKKQRNNNKEAVNAYIRTAEKESENIEKI